MKSTKLPVKYELPAIEELPIILKGEKKKKHIKAMADAQSFAKYGVHVLRVKARVLAALGREAEQAGIKQIGHGKILIASDNAESAVSTLGAIVDDLRKVTPAPDYPLILEIMRLQREFNAQVIHAAQVHFAVDKQPSTGTNDNKLTIPFPAGSAVMVGVSKAQAAIEDSAKPE